MLDSINRELTVDVLKLAILCRDYPYCGIISMDFFVSNRRRFSQGSEESPDVRWLYSQLCGV